MADLPDPNAPLTDWEKALLEKLFADPTQFPQRFKAWLADYVANNGNFHIESMPSLAGEEWREVGATGQPAFQNSMVNKGGEYATVAFCKDVLGYVTIKGSVDPPIDNGTVFTLPEGYRPEKEARFPSVGFTTGYVVGQIKVDSTGEVVMESNSGTYGEFHLNCRFRAA